MVQLSLLFSSSSSLLSPLPGKRKRTRNRRPKKNKYLAACSVLFFSPFPSGRQGHRKGKRREKGSGDRRLVSSHAACSTSPSHCLSRTHTHTLSLSLSLKTIRVTILEITSSSIGTWYQISYNYQGHL